MPSIINANVEYNQETLSRVAAHTKKPADKPGKCNDCGIVKEPDQFYINKRKITYTLSSRCKQCESAYRKRHKAKRESDPKELAHIQKIRAKWRAANKDKQAQYHKKRDDRVKAARIGKPIKVYVKKSFMLERQRILEEGRLSQPDAWKHWMSIAPDEWLDEFYSTHRKPWNDHRLTGSQQAKIRRKMCPNFAIYDRMRSHLRRQEKDGQAATLMREAIRREGSSPKIEALFGYTIQDLRVHLEKQFHGGMDWDRFCNGDIHIDHITPRSSFDMSSEAELQACWCLSNLRPMWASENIAKSNNIEYLI